jgi:hypothetical protein
MERRKYEKKSPYWNQFNEANAALPSVEVQAWKPETAGDPFYTSSHSLLAHTAKASLGSRMSNSDSTGQRVNAAAMLPTYDRFASIRAGLLPYKYSRDCVDVRDAIELCQKAFANVAVFRNAILLMAEFANTDIFLEGGTKKSRDFFEAWLRKIGIWKICNEFFLEYYRSSNIFIYRVDGAFDASDYIKLTQVYAAEGDIGKNKIPVKYIFLNPYDITSRAATAFSNNQYEKILSRYDLIKLKDPQTDEDREIFESLPKEAKDIISKKAFQTDGIRIKLSPDMLITSFASKMSYEPFAIPFGYPVLEDINAKLELKKMDQAILRTVENAILLITMGAKPDEGGINQGNLAAMQNLFKNESVGRVLISDWTTKAEFVIPDLKKVLGPEKYEVLNKDITEGLQNVIVGEEKYGNTQTKVQIFLEKLRVARNSFLLDFLQPEIRRIAKDLGMRKFPTAKFKQTDAKDPTQMWRVITRMMELSLLTPEQGLNAIRTGEFPDPQGEEFSAEHDTYVQNRKKGIYNPLNPVPVVAAPPPKIDPNNLIKTPSPTSSGKPSPKKKSKVLTPAGRPRDSKASVQDVGEVVRDTENLLRHIEESLAAEHGQLTENQKEIAESLMKSIVCAEEKDNWVSAANACLEDNSRMLGLNPRPEVINMAAEHDLSLYEAALLVHAQE